MRDLIYLWWREPDLNWWHTAFQAAALPTELPRQRRGGIIKNILKLQVLVSIFSLFILILNFTININYLQWFHIFYNKKSDIMRFTDATRDILTRLRARPTKTELTNLLAQITKDRLDSIIRDFWVTLEPKPTEDDLKKVAEKVTTQEIDNLTELSKKNSGKAFTKEDYEEFILDVSAVIDWAEGLFGRSQKRAACELLIASLPWKALKALGLETLPWNNKGTSTRIVRVTKD